MIGRSDGALGPNCDQFLIIFRHIFFATRIQFFLLHRRTAGMSAYNVVLDGV